MRNKILLISALAVVSINSAYALGTVDFKRKLQEGTRYFIDKDSYVTESICGSNDLQQVEFYDNLYADLGFDRKFVAQKQSAVGALKRSEQSPMSYCSGTLVAPNLFLTASHCVDHSIKNSVISFNYQLDGTTGILRDEVFFNIKGVVDSGVEIDSENKLHSHDYAILELDGKPGDEFGWRETYAQQPESVLIIQHPNGEQKQLDAGSDISRDGNYLTYAELDTMGGASGSGVLDKNGNLVAVHTNGGCSASGGSNRGLSMETIWKISPILPINNSSQVNSTEFGQQHSPAIALSADNSRVIAWEDESGALGNSDIYVRSFNADGTEKLHDFVVNSDQSGQQRNPDIAVDEQGNFVVVWEDDQDNNGYFEVMAKGFWADGSVRFDGLIVNSVKKYQQQAAKIDMNNDGSFVVVWQDGHWYYDIMAKGFNADGSIRFTDMRVNAATRGQQKSADVSVDEQGEFTVVWQDDTDKNRSYDIMAKSFDANGKERLQDFIVNSSSAGQQKSPRITTLLDGGFVVVWEDNRSLLTASEVVVKGFDYLGNEKIAEFTVNSVSRGQQKEPAINSNSEGHFIVAWSDIQGLGGQGEIIARSFDKNGLSLMDDYTVNVQENGDQSKSAVALLNGDDGFWAVWQDDADDNNYYEILTRKIK